MFIMNFKEIHLNTEFLSTYRMGDYQSPDFGAPRILYIFTKTTYITRNRKKSGPPESVSFLGRGVNCAKHKRHVAPNSLVNLGETVKCTVS